MLQSILSAVFLYHIIKAVRRASRKRRQNANRPRTDDLPFPLHPTQQDLELRLRRLVPASALGERIFDRIRLVLTASTMIFGLGWGLCALILFGMSGLALSVPLGKHEPVEWILLLPAAIGIGCGWMAWDYFKQARTATRAALVSGAPPVTGITPAAKPQPPIKIRKKAEKQFEEL